MFRIVLIMLSLFVSNFSMAAASENRTNTPNFIPENSVEYNVEDQSNLKTAFVGAAIVAVVAQVAYGIIRFMVGDPQAAPQAQPIAGGLILQDAIDLYQIELWID